MKKHTLKVKTLSLLLSFAVILNVFSMPFWLLSEALGKDASAGSAPPPSEVPDYIETVQKNPHNVDVSILSYPIYTSKRYHTYTYTDVVNGISSRSMTNEGLSPYYTGSLGVWYDHNGYDTRRDTALLTSNLPYREYRSEMFHPELQITDTTMTVYLNPVYRGTKRTSPPLISPTC